MVDSPEIPTEDSSPERARSMRASLALGERSFSLVSLFVHEAYNTGWSAQGLLAFSIEGASASGIEAIATLAAQGLAPGMSATAQISVHSDDDPAPTARTVRRWPSMVERVNTTGHDASAVLVHIVLVDPISYLRNRALWGAFCEIDPAHLIASALALAAGTAPREAAEVLAPALPSVEIRARHREALQSLPYVLGCGEPIGTWLECVLGTLGLRMEIEAAQNANAVVAHLCDSATFRQGFEMTPVPATRGLAERSADGMLSIRSHTAFATTPIRAGLLDDPTQGTPRAVLADGSPGTVVDAPGVDAQEAAERAIQPGARRMGAVRGRERGVSTSRALPRSTESH